jgi:Bifunctional DNA primase/polymerase, N-terminal
MHIERKPQTPSPQGHLGRAALAYAARLQWPVFPLRPGEKTPATAHGLKDASRDERQIQQWWAQMPDANIAIATGEASGFFAFDVDPAHGGDEELRKLEHRHGELPVTVRALTGGGGEHILFRHVSGLRNSASKIGCGIDVRADGGYIVVAPSLHPNRRRYTWDVDHHPLEIPIAEAPPWLVDLARGPVAGNGTQTTAQPQASGNTTDGLLAHICAGNGGWHDNVLHLVAHWVGRRWSDGEILATAADLTLKGYAIEQTTAEMLKMIEGARAKWDLPDQPHVLGQHGDISTKHAGYFRAALMGELRKLRAADPAHRFVALGRAAGALSRFAAAGRIDSADLRNCLLRAASMAGIDAPSAARIIDELTGEDDGFQA